MKDGKQYIIKTKMQTVMLNIKLDENALANEAMKVLVNKEYMQEKNAKRELMLVLHFVLAALTPGY